MFLYKADCAVADELLRGLREARSADLGLDEYSVRHAVAGSLGFDSLRIEPCARQGTFHRLFKVAAGDASTLVLKASALPRLGCDYGLVVEQAVSTAVRALGIGCPEVVRVDLGRHLVAFDFLIARFDAHPAARDFDDDESTMCALLSSCAAQLRRVHAVRVDGFGHILPPVTDHNRLGGCFARWDAFLQTRLDEHVKACRDLGTLDAAGVVQAFDAFRHLAASEATDEARLLHGDPGSHNLLTDGTRIVSIVDWEDALGGDPLYDLAMLASFHPQRRHSAIFRGYGLGDAVEGAKALRFWTYFLRIALAKTVHRARFAYRDAPGRVPAHDRIALALAQLGQLH
jgi:Phosphotransferase enzyme family